MRNIHKKVTWDIHILLTPGLYSSRRKPCHELKTPKEHQWSLSVSGGCDCGYHDSEARYECDNCNWGFDADSLASSLPVGNELFE